MKKYLQFITQDGNRDHILELTKNYSFFDGIFAVVHKGDKTDDTIKILEERKGEGAINVLDCYYMRHDLSMNINLFHPKIKHGDWIFLLDTLERINEDFYPEIDPLIEFFEENGIHQALYEGKTFFFRRSLYQQLIVQSPHWVLFNQPQVPAIELSTANEKCKNARINLRPQYRPYDHSIDHFVKYLWEFSESNHGLMECDGNTPEEKRDNFLNFENQRRQSRENAVLNGIPTDTLEFSNWLIDNKGQYPDYINDLLKQKSAKAFRNFYRYHVLKHDYDEIKKTENEWQYE
jgi:hypothetical protein